MAQMIIEIFAVPFFIFEKLCSSVQMGLYQTGEIVILANHFALVVNNGKEFLLCPQDLLAPICDADFRLILLSAMRYAMGRNTYMPAVVSDYIKRHIRFLDDKFLALAADDIRRHLEDYAEHEPNPNLWQGLFDAFETEQRARATRQARKIRSCPPCGKSSL